MIHFIPREMLKKFTREHPVQAVLFVAFGVVMMGITVWLVVSK